MDSKKSLRQFAKNERLKITNKEEKEKVILRKLLNHKRIIESNNILVYISMKNEVSTNKLIEELLKLNKNIYVPKIINSEMNFYKFNSFEELKLGKYNILEPTSNIEFINDSNSVIIVPGLLFDKSNNRLGYGGGYYDKYLENKNIYKIGICFSTFIVDKIIVDDYDIKMDEVITER